MSKNGISALTACVVTCILNAGPRGRWSAAGLPSSSWSVTSRMKRVSTTHPDHGLSGLAQTLQVLSDEKIQAFVAEVRARESLEDARDRETLADNLAKHSPDDFVDEAMKPAAECWLRWLEENAAEYELPEEWELLTGGLSETDFGKLGRLWLEFFARGLGPIVRGSAEVISRYIVMGFMAVPMACGLPATVVGRVPSGKKEYMVLAMVSEFSDIREVRKDIGRVYHETFGRRKQNKLPMKVHETLWLRFCARIAGRDEEVEAGKYRWLAELLYELRPELRPAGEPGDDGYEKRLERDADRIGSNCRHWETEIVPHLSGKCEH